MISIITINYNGSGDTNELVDSLVESQEEFNLVIVDNKSPKEGEVNCIRTHVIKKYNALEKEEEYENDDIIDVNSYTFNSCKVIIIQAKDNYGFSKGTNIGLKYSLDCLEKEKYICILNNDTIVTKFFLKNIIEKMEKFDLAAAMGTILYYGYDKEYIWSIGGPISWIKAQGVHLKKNEVYVAPKNDILYRNFISGCFTVFRTEALCEIGLLDEDYFFAGEEYQYSYDLSKKYKIGWVPNSIIYHKSVLYVGNGSSHTIKELCWQYNSYMVKIVFINKNRNILYRFIWHLLFKTYILTVLRKKYKKNNYSKRDFLIIKKHLFAGIHKKSFTYSDFMDFKNEVSF